MKRNTIKVFASTAQQRGGQAEGDGSSMDLVCCFSRRGERSTRKSSTADSTSNKPFLSHSSFITFLHTHSDSTCAVLVQGHFPFCQTLQSTLTRKIVIYHPSHKNSSPLRIRTAQDIRKVASPCARTFHPCRQLHPTITFRT